MRSSSFLGLLVLLVSTTGALPLPSEATFSSIVTSATSVTTLISTSPSSSEASTAAGSSLIASATTPSSIASSDSIVPTASTSSSANDSVIASATDSSTTTAADSTTDPSSIDSSALPTSTDNTTIVDPSATTGPAPTQGDDPTSTSIDPASSLASGPSAAPTNTAISFDIPEVPPACLALASGIVSTPSTSTLTSSLPSTTDSESSVVTISDTPVTSSSTISTDISSSSVSANATTSSDSFASTSTVNVTRSRTDTASASVSSLVPTATSAPANATLSKRIAQADLPDVAQSWQDLCLASGGDIFTNEPCVQLAGIDGINALLADADPCAQQDNADAMVDFAKSPGVTNTAALIANALAYRTHPRNAFSVNGVLPATPYCTRAPRNAEVLGVVNAQLDGVDPGVFGSVSVGLFAFGADGTCPFGQTPDVSTCGCS